MSTDFRIFYKITIAVILMNPISMTMAADRKINKITNEPVGVITFENSAVDFGTIRRGEKREAKFNFRNSGHGPLIIQGIQAPCDCTSVESTKGKVFAPNEAGTVSITFDSTDYLGPISKAVTVISNERQQPDRTLSISATVITDIEVTPPLIDFGDIPAGSSIVQTVKIKSLMKGPLKIEKLKYNDSILEATSKPINDQEFQLSVRLKEQAPIGFLKDTVILKNNSPTLGDLPVPIRANVKGRINLSSPYVEFGFIASGNKSTKSLQFIATDRFEISNNKVELMLNGTKVENAEKLLNITITKGDKDSKNLNLELSNQNVGMGTVHGKITFETNHAVQKQVVLDYYAFFN
jgi:hypothetical protein